jgi:hypothetical protein
LIKLFDVREAGPTVVTFVDFNALKYRSKRLAAVIFSYLILSLLTALFLMPLFSMDHRVKPGGDEATEVGRRKASA